MEKCHNGSERERAHARVCHRVSVCGSHRGEDIVPRDVRTKNAWRSAAALREGSVQSTVLAVGNIGPCRCPCLYHEWLAALKAMPTALPPHSCALSEALMAPMRISAPLAHGVSEDQRKLLPLSYYFLAMRDLSVHRRRSRQWIVLSTIDNTHVPRSDIRVVSSLCSI